MYLQALVLTSQDVKTVICNKEDAGVKGGRVECFR